MSCVNVESGPSLVELVDGGGARSGGGGIWSSAPGFNAKSGHFNVGIIGGGGGGGSCPAISGINVMLASLGACTTGGGGGTSF